MSSNDPLRQMPCRSCGGTGYPKAVRIEQAIKIITYECDRCRQRWDGAVPAEPIWPDVPADPPATE